MKSQLLRKIFLKSRKSASQNVILTGQGILLEYEGWVVSGHRSMEMPLLTSTVTTKVISHKKYSQYKSRWAWGAQGGLGARGLGPSK